jgi:nucleoid DNA-binding protein
MRRKKNSEIENDEELSSDSLTKRRLVVRISAETGLRQEDVFTVLQSTLDYIAEALREQKHVEFRDFGVFEVIHRRPRIGRNPNNPTHVVKIAGRSVVKFKAGRKLRQDVLKLAPKA